MFIGYRLLTKNEGRRTNRFATKTKTIFNFQLSIFNLNWLSVIDEERRMVGKVVELGFTVLSVTEETYADSFPMPVVHSKWFSCWGEGVAVQAVKELVSVLDTVVLDAKIELLEMPFPDERTLSVGLHKYALRCNAYATKLLSCTGKSGKAVATNFQ